MRKTDWKKYIPIVFALAVGAVGGIAGKAYADGSLPTYVGCSLPK